MAAPRISISISESAPNIANNTTTVTATLYYYGNGESWNASSACSITVNGSTKNFKANIGKNTNGVIGSHSVTVKHNDDGRKTIAYSAYADVSAYYGVTRTSGTYACKTIPRVSDLSVNTSSIIADGKSTAVATVTKKSSSFTDVITVVLGNYSKTVTPGSAFTIPKDWCNAIPDAISAIATVTVTTKSGSTVIGSKSANMTVKVPTDITPAITNIEISEANTVVTTKFGQRYVKNLSKLNVKVSGSGAYGSTIKDGEVAISNIKYLGLSVQSDYIKKSGQVEIVAVVKDSRGRSASMIKKITVVDYEAPTITKMEYYNCDAYGNPNSSGRNIKLTVAGRIYDVSGQNTRSLKIVYKVSGGAESVQMVTVSNWTFEVSTIISGTDPTKTYIIDAELSDKMDKSIFTLSTGVPVISRLAGGKGVKLFGEAEKEGFWVGDIDYTITDAEYQDLINQINNL